MDDNDKTPLIEKAITMAACHRTLQSHAIIHSDRGSNDMALEYGRTLKKLRIRHFVGRTEMCYDNAMAESFFAAFEE